MPNDTGLATRQGAEDAAPNTTGDALITEIRERATAARDTGKLLPEAFANLDEWLLPGFLPPWALLALAQLARAAEWTELNDRFFKKIAFGTGGLRGLTIGRAAAPAETGTPSEQGTPEHPAVGTGNMNDFTVARAAAGLFRYVAKWLEATGANRLPAPRRNREYKPAPPRLVIAHDVRHFSRHFCELTASVWTRLGGEAFIFDGPRSTPQLSFTVRHLRADAGIVITASHNPPQYNGFKCYFNDGAQVVPPHDTAIIAEVNAVRLDELPPLLDKDISRVRLVRHAAETHYARQLGDNILDPAALAAAAPTVLYTNIHGTGDVMIPRALRQAGAHVLTVPAQRAHDPRFPTVKSPNPENAEAFALALDKARHDNPDIIIGTDPDDDRMGAYARERDGSYLRLTGNRIGALLAAFRLRRMKDLGIIPPDGSQRVTLLKTFVTTPLQDAIAAAEGVRCVNTLTGFKWLAAKLRKYQERTGSAGLASYDDLPWRRRAALLQERSSFFVFGGEESYGYLGTDGVRDKDANAAALMLAELAAWLKTRGLTAGEYLDQLYARCGYHAEDLLNVTMPGADGSLKIRRILDSLRDSPPRRVAGTAVTATQDFGRQDIFDADGELVPKEDFFFFTLADRRQFAVRGSGTEPKIKFYLFGNEPLDITTGAGGGDPADLRASVRRARWSVARSLARLRQWLTAECRRRAAGGKRH